MTTQMKSTNGPTLDDVEFARGYIDDVVCNDDEVIVQGWMLHPEQEFTDLRLYLDGELVGTGSTASRPDLAKVFPWIPHAAQSGVYVRLKRPTPARSVGRVDLVGCQASKPIARMSVRYRTDLGTAVPTPSSDLMFRVAHTRNDRSFKIWGLKCYGDFLEYFDHHGGLNQAHRLLDWGCGCGRLTAHFIAAPNGPEVYGCDVDSEAVAWCEAHLQPGRFKTIDPFPPTPYQEGFFHRAIGYSVFTHLTREVQIEWLKEVRRILAPGGIFVATVHGESAASFDFPGRVGAVLVDGIHDGIQDETLGGIVPKGYYRGTFQTQEYTRRVWGQFFDILEYKVRGIGNHQDVVVMQRPA
ncbi:class I SAM-dependent methyltransferase [Fimbriiglobus ruber]|uniref:Methyltransferase n=1 Tax=Fimbriiglobus ruber TaxID=1908690 RepID=A0A225DZ92_9BACT|nr:class I SAM-dependent methyltransferase [Fimbriiglobus ruber]OWK46303.1 Methyltransferase [Fimbriiglobus ruber]